VNPGYLTGATGRRTRHGGACTPPPTPKEHVANTRWWPPFWVTVDWLAAMIMAVAISAGASFN